MSLGPRETDLLISDWIAEEAIFHLKTTSYWSSPDLSSSTKIHKIIYNVVNKNSLPVTRSWYMYGAFIHDYPSLGEGFEKFVARCIKLKRGPIKTRSKIHKILDNSEAILADIIYFTDFINKFKTGDYLDYLYYNETPEDLAPFYQAKHVIAGDHGNFKSLINYFSGNHTIEPLSVLDHIYDDISHFNSTFFNSFSDGIAEKNARTFFDTVEDFLYKSEYLIKRDYEFPVNPAPIFSDVIEYFHQGVWGPYACNITNDTVSGPWEAQVRKLKVPSWRKKALSNYSTDMGIIDEYKKRHNFNINYNEYKYILNKDDELSKNILNLLKTYQKRRS